MDKKNLKEVIREEQKKLSGLSWGERIEYIFTYYKLLFVVLFLIIFGIFTGITVYHNLHLKDVVQVYMINAKSDGFYSEEVANRFAEYLGGIGKNEVITIDDSITLVPNDMSDYGMAAQMKIVAATGSGGMDLLIADRETFEKFQKEGYFKPLDEILTQEELAQWSDRLAYRDVPQLTYEPEDIWETDDVVLPSEETAESYTEEAPDGQEKCYGIRVEDSFVLVSMNAFTGKAAYAAVIDNTERMDRSADFIRFLLTQEGTENE